VCDHAFPFALARKWVEDYAGHVFLAIALHQLVRRGGSAGPSPPGRPKPLCFAILQNQPAPVTKEQERQRVEGDGGLPLIQSGGLF
jgi:hypothetical protein